MEKGWEELLTHRDRLRVAFATEKGKVTQIVIVQYEAEIQGQWRPLVRMIWHMGTCTAM